VESKFEDTFAEEVKVIRSHGVTDTHIHAVLLILDPAKLNQNLQAAQQASNNGASNGRISKPPRIIGALDEDFDMQVLKTLQGKTVVVPVISKADTITTAHMAFLKKKVWESLKRAGLDPLEALNLEETDDSDRIDEGDEDESDADSHLDSPHSAHTEESDTVPGPANTKRPMVHKRQPSNLSINNTMMDSGYVPLSILSPDEYSLDPKNGPVGRRFPWGFADPFNAEHCDFVKLKEAVFTEWRAELREASRERFYETWRTTRLNRQGVSKATPEPRKSSGGIPISLAKRNNRAVPSVGTSNMGNMI
jgi:septin family protein